MKTRQYGDDRNTGSKEFQQSNPGGSDQGLYLYTKFLAASENKLIPQKNVFTYFAVYKL